MAIDHADHPTCPGCGEPIGTYEPLWRLDPSTGAEPTSWLQLRPTGAGPLDSLWHAQCAETAGIDGG